MLFYNTVLENKGVPSFKNRLHGALLRGFDKQIDMNGINRDMDKEILVQFLASAIAGMMEWWLTRSMPFTAEEVVEQLWTLMERNQMVPQPYVQ